MLFVACYEAVLHEGSSSGALKIAKLWDSELLPSPLARELQRQIFIIISNHASAGWAVCHFEKTATYRRRLGFEHGEHAKISLTKEAAISSHMQIKRQLLRCVSAAESCFSQHEVSVEGMLARPADHLD